MNSDGSILAELLLRFMYLTNEINKALARLGHALFWPVGKVELSDGSRLPILYTQQQPAALRYGISYIASYLNG